MGAVGLIMMMTVLSQVELFGRAWHLHTMVGGSLLTIAGSQVLSLGLCAQAYGSYFENETSRWFDGARQRFRLEHGLLLGGGLMLIGLVLGGAVIVQWGRRGFANLSEERLAVLASTMIVVGLQAAFSAFLLSIIGRSRPR